MSSAGCVLVAAGSGARLGADVPKAFVEVAGQTLLEHAVDRLREGGLADVVAVVPAAFTGEAARLLGERASVVAGGAERSDSVAAGLAALPARCQVVLVHDAARCLAPVSLVRAVAEAVRAGHPAVVPGLPVVDTIKQVDGAGLVVGTPDRAALRAVQTPQGFDRAVLERAHAAVAGSDLSVAGPATDDAAMVERLGVPVLVIDGHPDAFKITVPADLEHAQRVLPS